VDDARFDALARTLAGRVSRRRALGFVAAGGLMPLTAGAAPEPAGCLPNGKRCVDRGATPAPSDASARRGRHGRPSCGKCCSRFATTDNAGKFRCTCKADGVVCDNDAQCCNGLCDNGVCACAVDCDPGLRCQGGQCICDARSCPAGCVDATTCGASPCDQGLTPCNGGCVDTKTDPLNCGGCGNRCPVNETCVGGACVCGQLGHSAAPATCCSTDAVCVVAVAGAQNFVKPDPSCAFVNECPSEYTACSATAEMGCRACCLPGSTCVGGPEGGYCLQGGADADGAGGQARGNRKRHSRSNRQR
jgi:hypothetical protein